MITRNYLRPVAEPIVVLFLSFLIEFLYEFVRLKFVGNTVVNHVCLLFLVVADLTLVESTHAEGVQSLLPHEFLVLHLFVESVLQCQHVPHAYLGGLHEVGVPLLYSCFEVYVCRLETRKSCVAVRIRLKGTKSFLFY